MRTSKILVCRQIIRRLGEEVITCGYRWKVGTARRTRCLEIRKAQGCTSERSRMRWALLRFSDLGIVYGGPADSGGWWWGEAVVWPNKPLVSGRKRGSPDPGSPPLPPSNQVITGSVPVHATLPSAHERGQILPENTRTALHTAESPLTT